MIDEGGAGLGGKIQSQQQKKRKFWEDHRQLEHKAAAVEKECNSVIFSRRSEFRNDFANLEELSDQYGKNEREERLKLKQQLGRIKSNVEQLQRSLSDVKPSPKFVEKLKEIMEDIENSIMTYKAEQREKFEELLCDERVIIQELSALEKKFDSWSRLPAAAIESTRAIKKSSTARHSSSLPPAVAAFERFLLQTGGHRGGWDNYDHQEYLKLKQQTKTKNEDAFVHSALTSLPGKSYDDVRQHNDWYIEYLSLLEKKKKAIQDWKMLKDVEKMDISLSMDGNETSDAKEKRKTELLEKERKERLIKLDEWKTQQELEKVKEEEGKVRMELEEIKDKEREVKRRHEIKSQVELFARQREEEKEVLRMAEEQRKEMERENRKLTANDELRVQERNEKIISEKRAKTKYREMEELEKEKRLDKLRSKVDVQVNRDPTRLLRLTEGWKERNKASPSPSGRAMHMPHRAVPSWRQGNIT